MDNLITELLRKIIREELQAVLMDLKQEPVKVELDKLLTIEEAGELIHLSKPTIYGLVSRSEIPCMKKGKRLIFSRDELTTWLKDGRKKTKKEIDRETDNYLSTQKKK